MPLFGRSSKPAEASRHVQDVHATRDELAPWAVDNDIVEAMASVDLLQIMATLEYAPAEARYDAIAVAAQCERVPQNLVALLKPGGRLVCPLGPLTPIDSTRSDRFNPFWLHVAGAWPGDPPARSERAGPIAVNFLPLLPT